MQYIKIIVKYKEKNINLQLKKILIPVYNLTIGNGMCAMMK